VDPAVLDTAVDRARVNDDGRSGAALERVLLADGSRVVVKRFDPTVDLVMQLSGDVRGREVDLFRRGTLDRLPATLVHGDLTTVNVAFEPDRTGCLTLIDWGLAAAGPAELDVGRMLAGCAHLFGPVGAVESETIVERLDDLVALHREAAGPAYDETALRLGLLSGLTWLGWNKALDIVEHADPAVRERERVALPWWLHQAGLALDTGLI
jgi:hypothetical protein